MDVTSSVFITLACRHLSLTHTLIKPMTFDNDGCFIGLLYEASLELLSSYHNKQSDHRRASWAGKSLYPPSPTYYFYSSILAYPIRV